MTDDMDRLAIVCSIREFESKIRSAFFPGCRHSRGGIFRVSGRVVMHLTVEPAIMYFGTPVVLISTVNDDGSYNLAPMSSAFCLGWRCILGLAATSKTPQNMTRTNECVLNLPSSDMAAAVDCLALTTGSDPVPKRKTQRGYRYEKRKFGISGLTPVASETIHAPRVEECPIQLEATVSAKHGVAEDDDALRGGVVTFEVRIQRVHVNEAILVPDEPNRIDPDRWRPLIMSFQKFYGLESKQTHASRLGQIPESMYRSPDVDRARTAATVLQRVGGSPRPSTR